MNNPNPIIPFDAIAFFTGGYELVPVPHRAAYGDQFSFIIKTDGKLHYPNNWQGMRRKAQIRKVWVNVYVTHRDSVRLTGGNYNTKEEAMKDVDLPRCYLSTQEVEIYV